MALMELLENQALAAEQINKAMVGYKKTATAKRTKGFISERLNDIKNHWANYVDSHNQICRLTRSLSDAERKKIKYLTEDHYSDLEVKYFEFIGLLRDALDALEPPSASHQADITLNNSQEHSTSLKLPRITLPKFSGSYDSWRSFYDLFDSLVHNNASLQPVQKLHYLKTSVTGEAEHLLRQFPITNASYENAWKVLVDRYNNKRILINTQLKNLTTIPKVTTESARGIKNLLDKSSEAIFELIALDVSTKDWDPFLIFTLVQCLPSESHRLWEQEISSQNDLPTFKQFKEFLETRFRTLEAIADSKTNWTSNSHNKSKFSTHFSSSANKCVVCKELHSLYRCPKFSNFDVNTKYKIVNSNRLCSNCLSNKHKLQFCTSKFKCQRCGGKHHSLLHKSNNSSKRETSSNQVNGKINSKLSNNKSISSTSSQVENDNLQNFYTSPSVTNQALLATALVNVSSNKGNICTLRALIDSGSQVSFITQSAVKRLQLPTTKVAVQVSGLGKSQTTNVNCQTTIKLLPKNTATTLVNALVVPTITNLLPPSPIPIQKWKHIKNLDLADPQFYKPGKIDLLLGADVYAQIIIDGLRKGPKGTPTAQNSTLGWILFGNVYSTQKTTSKASTFSVNVLNPQENSLEHLLKKFWECEEIYVERKRPKDELECEQFYADTHSRDKNGRYQVRLPFKKEKPDLGDSRSMALRRFFALEKRLEKNSELRDEYKKCINEYLSLGHMRLSTTRLPSHICYYLPHHAVLKDSTTTKVRVVFDASAKSSNGKSLNEQLHTGPVPQSELFTTLMRWRKYRFAMSADIEKMYRMINMHPSDQDYQKIIWRNNPSEPLKEYNLTTVTFGTTPAPYLAIKTLQQLAKDETKNYPLAAEIAIRDFYVDDLLTGADTLEEALEIQNQIRSLLQTGGFTLRKWVSNSSELLANIPEEHREVQLPLRFASDESVKTLGIHWHPGADFFTLQCRQIADCLPTKRFVLSEIAKFYDPLGWISPIITSAKILMQTLWISGCSWDEPIPAPIEAKWQQFKSEAHLIEQIQLPRWLHTSSSFQNCQLHGFSDASIHAYSAVIYMRAIDDNNKIHVNLLIAKSKVAPIKSISLPRLELCGAVLLARLLKRIKGDLLIQGDIPTYAWTDSSIVLNWIRDHPNKYKTFVANRITEIQDLVDIKSWHHIRSQDNPADYNSRGVKPSFLIHNKLWWNGPKWLQESEENWPKSKFPPKKEIKEEVKRMAFITNTQTEPFDILTKFSSFTKLIRVVAYCFRFVNNCHKTISERLTEHLTSEEIEKAQICIIKIDQAQSYSKEIGQLQAGVRPNQSKILSLNPFIDKHGLLRIGGRLQNANISYSQQHPIILARDSNLTHLIIQYYHTKTLHGGTQLVLTSLRNKYWIPQGRKTVRNILHKCNICFRYSVHKQNQLMGNLPSARVNLSRPFQQIGVDYAGPINVKMSKHRGNRSYKAYICIFICMATKAVHIEAVSDLSTAAFIAAFRRFISRRGLCTDVYSDCGTNFIGANKEIKSIIQQSNKAIAEEVAHEGIRWHFNPPSAPHFGGLWEAGVKSIKHHLRRVLGNSLLTFEEFATVLTQIEACLNSRPLCPTNEDPQDINALTPGHFLIGTALNTLPDTEAMLKSSSINRWNYIQSLRHHFWSKWSKDYLNTLQNRPKWQKITNTPKIGDLVIIKEDNLPPCRWLLGRIIKLHSGSDKIIRVITLKTKNGILKRPIAKLCFLPKQ